MDFKSNVLVSEFILATEPSLDHFTLVRVDDGANAADQLRRLRSGCESPPFRLGQELAPCRGVGVRAVASARTGQ